MRSVKSLVGEKFGFLTVLDRRPVPDGIKNAEAYWLCKCECGKEKIIRGSSLKEKRSSSCGCKRGAPKSNKNEATFSSAKEVYAHNRYNDRDLSFMEFFNLSQLPCHYCGVNPTTIFNAFIARERHNRGAAQFSIINGNFIYNGLDRVDNKRKHYKNNVVTCCQTCNNFKHHLFKDEFLAIVAKLKNVIVPVPIQDIKISLSIDEFIRLHPYKIYNKHTALLFKIGAIKSGAISRKLEFSLTKEQCATMLLSPCLYCDTKPNPSNLIFTGVDRLDSDIGYISNNCVPACKYCNIGKNDLTFDEFCKWIIRIKSFQNML